MTVKTREMIMRNAISSEPEIQKALIDLHTTATTLLEGLVLLPNHADQYLLKTDDIHNLMDVNSKTFELFLMFDERENSK